MTTEEKAKAYDKAIEIAKEINNEQRAQPFNVMTKVFPELKESEDERIKKDIIWCLKHSGISIDRPINPHVNTIMKDAIAWLEKQGEQKPAVDTKVIIPKFRVGDIVKSKSQPMLSPRKIISIGEDCYWCEDRGCIGFAWEDDCEIVEQKPATWSEEDEKIIIQIKKALEDFFSTSETDKIKNWFKSLKYRIQPKPEWSEKDEQFLLVTKNALAKYQVSDKWDASIISRWLEYKLKSLRPQKQWKPTEEQMNELRKVITHAYFNLDVIDSLYQDLKAL